MTRQLEIVRMFKLKKKKVGARWTEKFKGNVQVKEQKIEIAEDLLVNILCDSLKYCVRLFILLLLLFQRGGAK